MQIPVPGLTATIALVTANVMLDVGKFEFFFYNNSQYIYMYIQYLFFFFFLFSYLLFIFTVFSILFTISAVYGNANALSVNLGVDACGWVYGWGNTCGKDLTSSLPYQILQGNFDFSSYC
jgi:hypothetical protein